MYNGLATQQNKRIDVQPLLAACILPIGKNALLPFCILLMVEKVASRLEACVFRARLRLRTFSFWNNNEMFS